MPSLVKNNTTTTPPKPDFKLTELGWIPKDWEVKKLGEIGNIITGQTPSTKIKNNFKGEIMFVTPADIKGNIVKKSERKTNLNALKKNKLVPSSSTLFVSIGSTIGKIGFTNERVFTNQQINSLNSETENNKFIFYSLSKSSRRIKSLASEQAVPILNKTSFSSIRIKLPPLPEQQAIADCLSTWDEAIEKQQQLIHAKQQQHKGLRQLLLTGKKRLTNPETGKAFDGEWVEKRLGEISTSFSGGTPSSSIKEYWNGKVHWIKSGELNQINISTTSGFVSKLGINNSSAKLVKPNTLLVAMYGATAGVCAITEIEGAINQAVLAIMPDETTNNLFLFYKLRMIMPSMVHRLTQGGQPNLSGGIIKGIKLNLPNLQEQTAIAEVLETSSKEIEILQKQLHQLQMQKKGLMQVLLSGHKRLNYE